MGSPRTPGSTDVITHHWQLLLLGLALAEAVFLPLYLLQELRTGDATAVDAGWSLDHSFFTLFAALYAGLGPREPLLACPDRRHGGPP